MSVLEAISPYYYGFSFLPLIIIAISIIGGGILLGIGFFIGQGVACSIRRRVAMNIRSSGVIALTFASIILLSGLWCMFLSPTSSYYENRENFYTEISIEGQRSWIHDLEMFEEDTLDGSVNEVITYEKASSSTFNFRIYDHDNNVIWSKYNVSNAYFNLKSIKSGEYRIEVQNPNDQIVDCSIRFTVRSKIIHRHLDPLGQWLSIISLPVFGFGIWTWLTSKTQRKNEQ